MLSLFSIAILAQATPTPNQRPVSAPNEAPPAREIVLPPESLPTLGPLQPQEIFRPQQVRPLPGSLDSVPVFNSNSPEIVKTEGILLSTFPPDGMAAPSAHLNFAFEGRFDIFSHHIARAQTLSEANTLFQGILIHNPTDKFVKVKVLEGASYLTNPDAQFINLPPKMDDPLGNVYAGPGSRVMNDVLRGRRQGNWASEMTLPPGHSYMLMNLPIPVGSVTPSSNGRSTLLRMSSSGKVYVSSLAMFAPRSLHGGERAPTLDEWQRLLINSDVAGPRDLPPTSPKANYAKVIYGRVAGVAQGSQWETQLTDGEKSTHLSIPETGHAFSYGISTLYRGTLGTGQIQSAKMLARYPDTAYWANGNYGIQYSLTLPLENNTKKTQTVTLALQTPMKVDNQNGGLLFFNPPEDRVFFRGPVRVRFIDDKGAEKVKYVHLVQQRGQQGEPLVTLTMPKGDRRTVRVDFLYPPDSTPPQVLTVRTLSESAGEKNANR